MSTSDQAAWSEQPEDELSAALPTIRRQAAPARQRVVAVEEPEDDEEGDFDLWIDDDDAAEPEPSASPLEDDGLHTNVLLEETAGQGSGAEPDDDLPDPEALFEQMQGQSIDGLPDPDTLFLQMQGATAEAVDDDLPDPDALFLQMQGAIATTIDDDLPDPDALFLQMQGATAQDDLPDPDTLFSQMQGAHDADDLPDPDALFLQMQVGGESDLPDPDALFLQMQGVTSDGRDEQPDLDAILLPPGDLDPVFVPMPPSLLTIDDEPDDGGLFLRLPDQPPETVPPTLGFSEPVEQPEAKALFLKMRSREATEDLLNLAPVEEPPSGTDPTALPLPMLPKDAPPEPFLSTLNPESGQPGPTLENDDFDLPDPDSLFLQMQSRAQTPEEADLPDPEALFLQMQSQESPLPVFSEDDLPDPNALFLQMQALEAIPPSEDLPDPDELFLQMQAHLAADHPPLGSPESTEQWNPPLPEPQAAHPQLGFDDKPEEKGSLFSRLKAKFTKDKKVDPDPLDALVGSAASASLISPAELLRDLPSDDDDGLGFDGAEAPEPIPDPAELFRRLQAGELDHPVAETPDGLPSLPDLDALRAEMEAEERAGLDADLLSDLSGPERFADTVSDLAFNTGTFFTAPPEKGSVHKPPQQRQDKFVPPPKPFISDEPIPEMLSKPAAIPKPNIFAPRPPVSQPEPARPAAAYQAAPKPVRRKSASTAIMPQEGAETRKIGAAANLSERIATYRNRRKALSRQTLCIVTRQMSAMIKAGISMHQALAFCAESDPVASPVLEEVCGKIESGYSMSGALREYPETFDAVYVGLVHAGELSGRMNEMLAKLADILERELDLRKRMISVVTYPAVLLAVSMLGTLGFIFFVLPQLTPLFLDLNVELPWPTKVLLSLRTVLLPLGVLLTTLLMVAVVMKSTMVAYVRARPTLERRLAYIPLGIPVIGNVYEKLITARVLYSLATMLEVGVTMNQALARVEGTSGNAYVGYRLARARIDLADGCTVTECFQVNQVFPDTALQLIAAGEESARLVDMFTYVARHFDEEVEQSMDAAAGLLEPLIMVVMGLIVGFITIAAALPTIKLLQGF